MKSQYRLLLDLFSKLSERQEFEAGNSMYSLKVMIGIFAVMSGLVNLIVAFGPRPPLRTYVIGNLSFTAFLTVMVLTIEAVNTFLNPVEAAVLAHQPIRDSSYFAAKLTYLAIVTAYVAFPINIVPSLAGLNLDGASWWYPPTYLISTYVLGFFIALMGCGILGILFRVLSPARVRNAALWLQMGFFMLLGLSGPLMAAVGRATTRINIADFTTLPIVLATIVCCGVFIGFGIHSLSKGYLGRVNALLRSGPLRTRGRSGLLGAAVRLLTDKPSGRAAFAFVYGMAKTDWQFRRTVYPMLVQLLIIPLLAFARTRFGHSPFEPGTPTAAQLLPHVSGIIGLITCFAISYSNQHRAAWIFLTFPMDGIRSFVRGIFWSLWFLVSALPLLLAPFLSWYWGIFDAGLFLVYSVAVGSFYLSIALFLIDGLPFANPPEAMKGSMTAPLVFASIIGALILVGLQWLFIFQSRFVTAGAVLVFAGAAYVIAQTSLRYLEVNVLHNLHRVASGRTAMFREL